MNEIVKFVFGHGSSLLFAWVLAEGAGLPLPSAPVLLAAGALAGTRRMYLLAVVAMPLLAASICDTFWYLLGRWRGVGVLRLICRISLEPDSCVRRTQLSFERRGPWGLIVSKFVPGLGAMMGPLAGVLAMRWRRFALLDALGAVLGSSSYMAGGFIISRH